MLKKIDNLFACAYLTILLCIYPFYVQDGYVNIGEAKNRFFLYVSIAAFAIFIICGLAHLVFFLREKGSGRRPYLIEWERISATDLFVMLYATCVFWSYILTEYRQEALWGTEGWYIGCIPLILLCGLYFMISRMWDGGRFVLHGCMAASAAVFLLGICNRFSFYPVKFEIIQPDFISTLGNINWFCGYLAVTAPVGICLFLFWETGRGGGIWRRVLCGAYTVIAFMAGFSQGSSSVFLWFAALFLILLWIVAGRGESITDWLILVFLWGMSAQLVRLLRFLLPERYNYDLDNLCGYFTSSSFTTWVCLGAAFGFAAVRVLEKRDGWKEAVQRARVLIPVSVVLGMGMWLVLAVINTGRGIPLLQDQSLFRLGEDWGNGRGAAFRAGVEAWREMPLLHKLVGVGPDCFSRYAYSLPETAAMLRENFGQDRLCNTHNELLTELVNTGALGVCLYAGIFISFIRGCMKTGRRNPQAYLYGVCAFCYLAHNMVSFAQVLNLPFAFVLMGMGEAVRRKSQTGGGGS